MGPEELNYSFMDRLVHRVAFAAWAVQFAAADLEQALYASSYSAAHPVRPVFVTSLPRAGTTLLLEALHLFPCLATHTYRDMPFVMAPVLWSRLSGGFHKRSAPKERAHGDGVQVGYDSPEAFEEIVWRAFWPKKYRGDSIALWDATDVQAEATGFLVEHMKKIIALRRPDRIAEARYASKNNANIARIDVIGGMFPDARILVPVRHPVEQAVSLLRQHRNFLSMHEKMPFVKRYMADIGHYEFGALHRPIAFPGLAELTEGRDPLDVNYWLGYWIAAFDYVLARRDRVFPVSFERTCENSAAALSEICAFLDIQDEAAFHKAAALFRPPPQPRTGEYALDDTLRARAEALHAGLLR